MTRPAKLSREEKRQIVSTLLRAELTAAEARRRLATSETSVAKSRDRFSGSGVAALKNVELFSGRRPFRYERGRIGVEIERREQSIADRRPTLHAADRDRRPQPRLELFHSNTLRYATTPPIPLPPRVSSEERSAPSRRRQLNRSDR